MTNESQKRRAEQLAREKAFREFCAASRKSEREKAEQQARMPDEDAPAQK